MSTRRNSSASMSRHVRVTKPGARKAGPSLRLQRGPPRPLRAGPRFPFPAPGCPRWHARGARAGSRARSSPRASSPPPKRTPSVPQSRRRGRRDCLFLFGRHRERRDGPSTRSRRRRRGRRGRRLPRSPRAHHRERRRGSSRQTREIKRFRLAGITSPGTPRSKTPRARTWRRCARAFVCAKRCARC